MRDRHLTVTHAYHPWQLGVVRAALGLELLVEGDVLPRRGINIMRVLMAE